MRQNLREVGDSFVLTVPETFPIENGLEDGSRVDVHFEGKRLTVEVPIRPRYRLADLMAEMKGEFPRVEGWDDLL
jgi:antitoxin ChpS